MTNCDNDELFELAVFESQEWNNDLCYGWVFIYSLEMMPTIVPFLDLFLLFQYKVKLAGT